MYGLRRGITRSLSILAVMAMAIATFAIPASAQSGGTTIADTAIAVSSLDGFDSNNQDFDMLIQALIAADLVDAVADPGADLTVFAPTDQAFIRLARDLGYKGNDEAEAFGAIVDALTVLGDGDPIPVLTKVLLYHVSPGSTPFAILQSAGSTPVRTLLGVDFTANKRQLVDAAPSLRDPWIKRNLIDIGTSNGIIHGISRVLLPVDLDPVAREIRGHAPEAPASELNIVETAIAVSTLDGFDANKDDFDILLQAVLAADLAGPLSAYDADLTVFAPTDRAFMKLARDLGLSSRYDEAKAFEFIVEALTDLGGGDPIPVLTDVLLYHVAPGETEFKQLQAARTASVPTLLGADLRINVREIVDAAPARGNARIIPALTDVDTSNGVIHGISRVLLPVAI